MASLGTYHIVSFILMFTMATKWLERKNILPACIGSIGLGLVFVAILMILPSDMKLPSETMTVTATTITTRPKTWAEDVCLFSMMKRTERAFLTFCYDKEKNERLTIYCNGTAVAWSKDAIRRTSMFLK